VTEGEPKDPAKFSCYEAGPVKVYINKSIVFNKETARLDIRKFLFTKEIFVDGVDIAY
jgi:hypothetical protein